MLIGMPKEIKDQKSRGGLIPSSVRELVYRGHQVLVQSNAGHAIGLDDHIYEAALPYSLSLLTPLTVPCGPVRGWSHERRTSPC